MTSQEEAILAQVDAQLNAMDAPSSAEVFYGLEEFSPRHQVAAAARVAKSGGGGGGNVPFVGDDPPDSPTDGMLWWDPDDDTPPSGESQLETIRITVAFDTPNFPVVGTPIYTPTVNDIVGYGGLSSFSIKAGDGFNGTTPTATLFFQGDDYNSAIIGTDPVGAVAENVPVGTHGERITDTAVTTGVLCLDTTPVCVVLHDGAGGNPASTAGEMTVVLSVLHQ